MGFAITRWQDSSILVITRSGTSAAAESAAVMEAVSAQELVADVGGVLFDLRNLQYIPTVDEARDIARRHAAFSAEQGCRFAYVAPSGAPYGVARMVEMLSESLGGMAAVFTTFEAAIQWLEGQTEAHCA